MKFYVAEEKDILDGSTADIYFIRTKQILDKEHINKRVVAEITLQNAQYPWLVFTGIEEVAKLMEGHKVDIYSLPEGTIFKDLGTNRIPVPVMIIEGDYKEFSIFETAILGLICQSSGIATKTARFKYRIGDKNLMSFGVRRMHPILAPMVDRYAYMGGCDAVSSVIGAKSLHLEPTGTMPHALILTVGEKEAWEKFDENISRDIMRIALIDTFGDEKWSAIQAAETVKDLDGVRLDTPRSRKGDLSKIVREVRWELDIRGYKNIKIFVSGGISEEDIKPLLDAGVDGFGVGTAISSAQTIDFAMDIVSVEGLPKAKKGKYGGKKTVYKCENCLEYYVLKEGEKPTLCNCSGKLKNAAVPIIKNGKIVYEFKEPGKVREYVLEQLKKVTL
jgi:nicotinate phosphoribosyltransferase